MNLFRRVANTLAWTILVVPAAELVAQETPAQPMTSTLTVKARLVVLDVVVRDGVGKYITDIDRDKFLVYEDGVLQKIRDFEPPSAHMMPVRSEVKAAVNSAADLPKIGTAPVNVLVFDELNTPFNQLAYARKQMVEYLMSQPEVLPVPTLFIAAGNSKMAVLHDYTQSRSELLESVKKHTVDIDFTMMLASLNGGASGKDDGLTETLGALSQIAESVVGIRGRKNVIWVGSGYDNAMDLNNLSQADLDRGTSVIQKVLDRLQLARITLYSIDTAGPIKPADVTLENIDPTSVGTPATRTNGGFGENLSFAHISDATGGHMISGHNDIAEQLRQVELDETQYYTISYAPTNKSDASRKYRNIRVIVNNPNVAATTRKGYFSGDAPVSKVALEKHTKQPQDLMFDIMTAARTTLPYTGLHMDAQKAKIGFNLMVNATDLQFDDQPDGTRMAEVTVLAVCFDRNHKISGQRSVEMKEQLSAKDKITLGAKIEFAFPMVVPAFTDHVRFVMRDAATGTIGSAEIKP